RIGDDAGIRQHHGVAVWRRARDHVCAHHAAGAGPVLGHDRLSQTFTQPKRKMAAGGVDDAARCVRQDEVDRLAGISLPRRRRRSQRRRPHQAHKYKSLHALLSPHFFPNRPSSPPPTPTAARHGGARPSPPFFRNQPSHEAWLPCNTTKKPQVQGLTDSKTTDSTRNFWPSPAFVRVTPGWRGSCLLTIPGWSPALASLSDECNSPPPPPPA